jgi:hypothetical protein
MGYDYTGRQVWKKEGSVVTRYYSPLAEVRGTKLTKYYFAGGLRIAERVTTAPVYLASVPGESPAVRLAEGPGGEMVLALRQDWGRVAAGMACVAVLGLLAVPGRRRAVVGITVRRGQVLVVLVAWTLNVVPVPWKVRTGDPHLEIGLGSGEALGQTVEVNHYHLDRLGSTVLVTDRLQAATPSLSMLAGLVGLATVAVALLAVRAREIPWWVQIVTVLYALYCGVWAVLTAALI